MTTAPADRGPARPSATSERSGLVFGFGAYLLWGSVPLYWPLLARAGALEILASRVIWSLVFALLLLLIIARRGFWRRVGNRRTLVSLAAAASLIAINWGVYIWAVNNGHVVDAALGYYVNPILSVLLGVLVLRERLGWAQWAAVGLAGVAVIVLTVDYGRPPVIALTLAVTFATYGLIKNRVAGGALDTLTVESALLTPVAVAYLVYLQVLGQLTFGHLGWQHTVLLISAGAVTLVPLLLFSAAATRIPLSTLGLLQYLTPTAQFLLGVVYFGESMSPARWVGFGVVWLALVILTTHALLRVVRGRQRNAALEPPTAA